MYKLQFHVQTCMVPSQCTLCTDLYGSLSGGGNVPTCMVPSPEAAMYRPVWFPPRRRQCTDLYGSLPGGGDDDVPVLVDVEGAHELIETLRAQHALVSPRAQIG